MVDANANPMPGITVVQDGGTFVNETLTDGTRVQVQLNGGYPSGWNTTCTSDDNGQCSFTALVGSAPYFYANTQLQEMGSTPGCPTIGVSLIWCGWRDSNPRPSVP